jgi:hypothetical protein
MNEKIKELAEQATEVSEWLSGNCCPDAPDLEKFAELLVRQCIKSTLSLRDTAIDNEWNLDETFHMIVDTIVEDLDMQHIFRVE